ncbi:NAD(P)H-binding protein [Nonomuraea thailandensis]
MILVTGAAGGQQGSTGRLVTELLLERGEEVRAFVRADDERAAELRKLGAEVVVGDLREISAVRPAMRGVTRAFFTYPVTAGLLDATAAFAAAARQEGWSASSRCRSSTPSPRPARRACAGTGCRRRSSTGPGWARCTCARRCSSRTWPSSRPPPAGWRCRWARPPRASR